MPLLLQIYIVGCIAALFATLLYEGYFNFKWNYSMMSLKEWVQDILGSFLSWITVLLVIIMWFYTYDHPNILTRDCDKKKTSKAH